MLAGIAGALHALCLNPVVFRCEIEFQSALRWYMFSKSRGSVSGNYILKMCSVLATLICFKNESEGRNGLKCVANMQNYLIYALFLWIVCAYGMYSWKKVEQSKQLFHAFVGNNQSYRCRGGVDNLMHCCPRPSGRGQQCTMSSTAPSERRFPPRRVRTSIS